MRLLLDTNVILDVLLRREPWRADAEAVWRANDERHIAGCLTAMTLTDIFYVARRSSDLATARQAVQLCLDEFEIVPVRRHDLERALQLSGPDYEDNLQIACAEAVAADAIVTRDQDNYQGSTIPIWSPAECRRRLE
jgi:predicted nucleic acid-binding protein